jgi:hypothetical protein
MPRFEFVEELAGRTSFTLPGLFQTLPDAFLDVSLGCDIKQPLICFGVLHYGGGFSLDRQYNRTFSLSKLLHEITGPPSKGSQGLNVASNVQRCHVSIEAPF